MNKRLPRIMPLPAHLCALGLRGFRITKVSRDLQLAVLLLLSGRILSSGHGSTHTPCTPVRTRGVNEHGLPRLVFRHVSRHSAGPDPRRTHPSSQARLRRSSTPNDSPPHLPFFFYNDPPPPKPSPLPPPAPLPI